MSDSRGLVIDTSVWMENLIIIESLFDKYEIKIPYLVLEELDNLKDNYKDSAKSFKARNAIKFIDANYGKFEFIDICSDKNKKNDDLIIDAAKIHKCSLATFDICMKIKAKILQIPLIELNNEIEEYKGYKVVEINTNENNDNEWLANIYENKQINPCDLLANQYLIIRDKANPIWDSDDFNYKTGYKTIDIFRWNGNELVELKLPPKKIVQPMNDLQSCALDLLMNKNIPIKIISGVYGSGKSILSTLVGLYLVEDKGIYSKMVIVRNNDLAEGKDPGALPGSLQEKSDPLFRPVTQHFPSGEYQVNEMKRFEKLEMHITYYIKGLSINGYMLVEESGDLTTKNLKAIGSRLEKDGCIVFCGDWEQASGKYKNDNGLLKLINETKDNQLVGTIVLDEDVRSEASKVFVDLI